MDFYARSQNYEKRQLALSCLSVCLSVRPSICTEQLGSTGQIFKKFDKYF